MKSAKFLIPALAFLLLAPAAASADPYPVESVTTNVISGENESHTTLYFDENGLLTDIESPEETMHINYTFLETSEPAGLSLTTEDGSIEASITSTRDADGTITSAVIDSLTADGQSILDGIASPSDFQNMPMVQISTISSAYQCIKNYTGYHDAEVTVKNTEFKCVYENGRLISDFIPNPGSAVKYVNEYLDDGSIASSTETYMFDGTEYKLAQRQTLVTGKDNIISSIAFKDDYTEGIVYFGYEQGGKKMSAYISDYDSDSDIDTSDMDDVLLPNYILDENGSVVECTYNSGGTVVTTDYENGKITRQHYQITETMSSETVTTYRDTSSADETESAPDGVDNFTDDTDAASGTLVGGWSMTKDDRLTQQALNAFDKATGNILGAKYEYISFLGSQLVSGTNYCYLARRTMVTAEPVTDYVLLYVYEDLSGNVSITGTKTIILGEMD